MVLFKRMKKMAVFRTRPIDMPKEDLVNVLTLVDLTFAGIGAMIGSGIFVLIGVVTVKTGPSVVLAIILAGVLAMCSALCYSEFASFIPAAGSAYTFVYTVAGELPAWMIGWTALLEFNVGVAAISRGWAGYTVNLLSNFREDEANNILEYKIEGTPFSLSFISPIIIGVVTALTSIGISESSTANIVLCSIKIFVLLAVFCGGMSLGDPAHVADAPFAPNGVEGIVAAAATLSFAYSGFDQVSMLAEEAVNPTRDLPWAIFLACLVATVLYCMTAFALTRLVPYNEVDVNAPLSAAFTSHGATAMSALVAVGAFTGITSALLMGVVGACRQWYALSRDGLLPEWIKEIDPKYRTPLKANIASGVFSAAMGAVLDLEQLARLLAVGTLFSFASVGTCLLLMRHGYKRRAKLYLTVLWILAISFGAVSQLGDPTPESYFIFVGLILEVMVLVWYVPRVETPAKFVVPLGPFLPLFCIVGNLYIVMGLGTVVALRFFVWLFIGLLIYKYYGFKHSLLNTANAAAGNDEKAPLVND